MIRLGPFSGSASAGLDAVHTLKSNHRGGGAMGRIVRALALLALVVQFSGSAIASADVGNMLKVRPGSAVQVNNCIPFGNNTDYGFTGFIYRDLPAFTLPGGHTFGFDLGGLNDVATKRNIYFATANKNPDPPVIEGGNVVSQGVAAEKWVQVVREVQTPKNPQGDTEIGNFELRYRAMADFVFTGGALIVGFGSAPPGNYQDVGCEATVAGTVSDDASGHFYARFCFKDDQTYDVLDEAGACAGTAQAIGGIVIDIAG
jgi:hypothetical protein